MIGKHTALSAMAAVLLLPSLASALPGRGLANPLKNRRCIAACRVETNTCLADARQTVAPCFDGCKELVMAARAACVPAATVEDCRAAVAAARACLDPCQAELRPLVRACVADGHDCAVQCPFVGESSCVTKCRADHVACVGDTRMTFNECRAGCADEVTTARMACADDPASDACTAAKHAVSECLVPCYEAARDGLRTCREARRACVGACGDAAQ